MFPCVIIQPQPIDSQLRGCIGDFLRTVQDPDLVSQHAIFFFLIVRALSFFT